MISPDEPGLGGFQITIFDNAGGTSTAAWLDDVATVFDSVAACLGISPNEPLPIVPPNADDVPAVVLDPSRTRGAFGWTAKVGLSESIARMVRWYEAYGVSAIYSHLQPSPAAKSPARAAFPRASLPTARW